MVDSWETRKLTDLVNVCVEARSAGKYIMIWDQQGQVPTFFRYQCKLFELAPLILREAMGDCTPDFLLESLRAAMVHGMRAGHIFGVSLEKCSIDFSQWKQAKECPLETVFDFKKFREHDTYFKITKPEERHGHDGVVHGEFHMNEDFQIAITSQGDAETVQKIWDSIPNNEQWAKVIIQ